MDVHEHAKDGRLVTWVLAPRDDPTTLDFLCSCETMRRTGIVANHRGLSEVSCFGIASVYTPPEKRGKGYAGHMMRLLHWFLAPRTAFATGFPTAWGPPPDISHIPGAGTAQFSALYSDIGKDFYRACGPSDQIGHGCNTTLVSTPSNDWLWLKENDVKSVWEHDTEWMRSDVVARAAATGHTAFSFLPGAGVGAFTIQRSMSFTDGNVPVLPTDIWGVALLPNGPGNIHDTLAQSTETPLTYATWTLDVRSSPRTLVVTRLRAAPQTLPRLLDRIVEAGRRDHIERLEIWGLPSGLQEAARAQGWTTEDRVEHLSAFKWYGPEPEEEIEWLFNERFCWC